ncbi:MAG: diphthine--ammonia ligase [Candidatus Bathyarchaeota archaeon]|nr:MAG: diphthine--ammonia ligase [Candidatus Bathyarchaeota archaeon]
MRLASLFSGGKDSTYATRLAMRAGHEVECLVTALPRSEDSWMFHTVNIDLAPLVGEAMGIKSVTAETEGRKERETEDLRATLSKLNVEGVVTGAIASTYQRSRVDAVCSSLGLEHIAPLWGRDGHELLGEMLSSGLVIMVTAVAAMGFDERWLGRILDEATVEGLMSLNRRYGVDVCGEGGEMETLVLDAPWFRSSLQILEARREWDGVRGALRVEEARLIPKDYT